MLVRADGSAELLLATRSDRIIGLDAVDDRARPRGRARARLVLLLYTDGLVERRGQTLDVGLERLRAAAAGSAGRSVDDLVDHVLASVADPHGDDDVAVLGVRFGA